MHFHINIMDKIKNLFSVLADFSKVFLVNISDMTAKTELVFHPFVT